MKNTILFFAKHQILVNLLIILMILFGTIAAINLSSSFFPQLTTQFIVVQATYPGASPEEIEEGVTLKIEESLEGIEGIERVTSVSSESAANIQVELESGADEDLVLQEVKNAIDGITSFPVGLEQTIVFKQKEVNEVGTVAVYGDAPLSALKEAAEQLEDDLRSFDGLSQINLSGYTNPEIEIALRENDLRRYGLTFQEVSNAIAASNIRVTGGTIKGEELEYTIRVDERYYFAKELVDIVVKANPDGSVVRLKDVAIVKDDWSEDTNKAYLNGTPAILISIATTNEEDILAASAYIDEAIERFNRNNELIEARMINDAVINLKERITLLQENGLLGILLVFILLGLFLKIRVAFWVAMGIPISFFGMIILAAFFGITINVISLFGMIIVIGILVDDGIVVGENIYQKIEDGYTPLRAAVDGTLEVLPAITSAILTTCTAFAFFYFIDGQLGDFFSEVSFVVIASLAISLIEVILFLPAHLAHIKVQNESAPKEPSRFNLQAKVEKLLYRVRDKVYVPFLEFSLDNKTLVVLSGFGFLIIAINAIGGGYVKTTFFPNVEGTFVFADLEMPQGTSEAITADLAEYIEESAWKVNQRYLDEGAETDYIKDISVQLGPGSNKAVIFFYLAPSEERDVRSFDVSVDIKNEVGAIPRAKLLSFQSTSFFGKPVSVSLASNNYAELRNAKEMLKLELNKLDELRDIIDTDNEEQPEISIKLKDKAYLLGLTLQDVIGQVRSGFFGSEVQRLQRGDDEVKVWVRYNIEDRRNVSSLLDMRIRTQDGSAYPLSELADISFVNGLVAINHRDGRREIRVDAELSSLDVSATDVLGVIQEDILPTILAANPSVDYEFEGQVRETEKTAESASTALPVIMIILFSIVVWTFRSSLQAAVLYMLIPFGIIGTALGHFIHDAQISLLSMLGFVALIGIIVNDGLVFINAFNERLRHGSKLREALIETGKSRFRPIVLTTITTAAGLAPLIFEKSFQAQFLVPMAITIAYGLVVATVLLLALLPSLLLIANYLRRILHWIWEGEWLEPEKVEPAYKELEWEEIDV